MYEALSKHPPGEPFLNFDMYRTLLLFQFYLLFLTVSIRHVLVSADYSQIEMRVLAHLCKDPILLSLFGATQGYDIYRHLAARILNRPVADVPEEDRTKAKVICLGTPSAFSLSVPDVYESFLCCFFIIV